MRTNRGANDIKRIRVGTPVTNGFVGGILQCHVAAGDRFNRCTQHPHFLNIQVLPFHICFTHKHDTFHAHKSARGSCSHSMLSGTCFSQYFCFSHAFGKQDLSQSIVDFMSAGVIKVFPFQINVCAVGFRKSFGMIQRRGASYVVFEQVMIFVQKTFVGFCFEVGLFQLVDGSMENFRNISASEFSVIAVVVDCIVHCCNN